MKINHFVKLGIVSLILLFLLPGTAVGQAPRGTALGSAFTYQGELISGGTAYEGSCDFQFGLYDAATMGSAVGEISLPGVSVSEGLFTVQLDFGSGSDIFNGDERWLEIWVRCPAGNGDYQPLHPRQLLTAAPYALYAPDAGSALYAEHANLADGVPWAGITGMPVDFSDGIDNEGWSLTGNAGTLTGTQYLGTSDNQPFEIKVNGERVFRFEPNSTSPNLIGGSLGNTIKIGVHGATISGGGGVFLPNLVTDHYGTIGGGIYNRTGNNDTTLSNSYATISGGYANEARGEGSTVGGGDTNRADGAYSTVAGGYVNIASGHYATVSGGDTNTASGIESTVGGGGSNTASYECAVVGGGSGNIASSNAATVGGGNANTASGDFSTAGGGDDNVASGGYSSVSGGKYNQAVGDFAAVGGGWYNVASAKYTTIAGGGPSDEFNFETTHNLATDMYCTVGGGGGNQAGNNDSTVDNAKFATVNGGYNNEASGQASTIGGGGGNLASYENATVSGGYHNTATSNSSTVSGGSYNTASYRYSTVGGGSGNTASGDGSTVGGGYGNTASGLLATVPGGYFSEAVGDYSFAAGYYAISNNTGCFTWADSSVNLETLTCDVDNRWVARASGGVYFYTNSGLTSGMYLDSGGSAWNTVSNRELKENFNTVDSAALLEALSKYPITTWNYKSQEDSIRHIGMMADEFNSLMEGLGGEGEDFINSMDANGVALAAIQGLYAENQDLKARVDDLEAENSSQQSQIDELAARLNALDRGQNQGAISFPFSWLFGFGLLVIGDVYIIRRRSGGGL